MKKLLLSVSTLVLCNALNAQTGNVGINTQNPTENLNVNGTFRVNELPTNGQKINTTASGSLSSSKNQNFAPTKMVVVDNNGVFGKADIPSSGGTYSGSTSIKLDGTSFKRMALTGDATALENSNATKVVAIQGKPVATTAPTANQVLQWKNNAWTPSTLPTPTTYTGSTSIKLDGTSFKRMALTGDATAPENSNTTKVVAIQGKPVVATAPTANQVLQWKNNAWTPSTLDIPEVPKDPVSGTGSVIAIGGKLQIAEEITATMLNQDFNVPRRAETFAIPYLQQIEVNNKSLFNPTETGNTFQVSQEGKYQIIMNILLENTRGNPVIGIWDNVANKWVARVSNSYGGAAQVYTLITAITLKAKNNYSFRIAPGINPDTGGVFATVVKGFNGGTSGEGPATFVSVKRIK